MEEINTRLQSEVCQYVASMGKWYKFIAILLIIAIAFMVLAALTVFAAGSLLGNMLDSVPDEVPMRLPVWAVGMFYLVCAGVYVPMAVYLLRASSAAQQAASLKSNDAAAAFLRNSKSYWKYCGILTIVIIALGILAFIAAIAIGVMMAAQM